MDIFVHKSIINNLLILIWAKSPFVTYLHSFFAGFGNQRLPKPAYNNTSCWSVRRLCPLQYIHVQHLTGSAYSAKHEVCKILNTHDCHCVPDLSLQDDTLLKVKIHILDPQPQNSSSWGGFSDGRRVNEVNPARGASAKQTAAQRSLWQQRARRKSKTLVSGSVPALIVKTICETR